MVHKYNAYMIRTSSKKIKEPVVITEELNISCQNEEIF